MPKQAESNRPSPSLLKQKTPAPQRVFYGVWLLIFAASLLVLIHTGGGALDFLVHRQGADRFMDFFNHISYVSEHGLANVYKISIHACFPPLTYLMYYFFSLILPQNATAFILKNYTEPASSYALLLYVWYCTAVAAALCLAVVNMMPKDRMCRRAAMVAVLITSNIFIFGVLERGNSVILACLCLMWAVILRGSEEKYQQELALILIAIAAAIKIYPAVFGLLYIFEKKWDKAARLILYGLAFFFVPFCFTGGWEGFCTFLANQIAVQKEFAADLSNINALYNYIVVYKCNGVFISHLGGLLTAAYFVLAALAAYVHTDAWKRIYLLASIMILCPFWSGNYTRIFLAIPLILFMADRPDANISTPPPVWIFCMPFCSQCYLHFVPCPGSGHSWH